MTQYSEIKDCYNNICQEYNKDKPDVGAVKGHIGRMINAIDPTLRNGEREEISNMAYTILALGSASAPKSILKKGMQERTSGKIEQKTDKDKEAHSSSLANAFKGMCHGIAMFFRKVMKKPTIADQVEQTIKKLVKENSIEIKRQEQKVLESERKPLRAAGIGHAAQKGRGR